MKNNFLVPTGFEVARHEDGEMVKITFEDDQAHSSEIMLGKTNLPLLISELQKYAPAPRAEMKPGDISPGNVVAVRGVKVAPGQDGGVNLILSVELDRNRGIDLPMNLTAIERDGLVRQLMAFVQKS